MSPTSGREAPFHVPAFHFLSVSNKASVGREGEARRGEGIWMEMSGHVKERKVLYHKFSRGVPVLFRSGDARGNLIAERGSFQ